MKKKPTADNVADDILGLFQSGDTVQLLVSGQYPEYDIGLLDGMQLAVNCLCECISESPGLSGETKRHATIKKALTKHAKDFPGWFVICYRLEGSQTHNLGWSSDIDYYQAFNIVLRYIEYITESVSYEDAEDPPDNFV